MENKILENGVFYAVVNGIASDAGIVDEMDDDKIVVGLVKAGVIRELKLSLIENE